MSVNERTSLLGPQQNGNGVLAKKGKLIISMPKDPIFAFEDYWGGLNLEELLPYQDDPWWQRLRKTIVYSFWLMVFLTFITACVIAYFHSSSSCKIINSATSTTRGLLIDAITGTTITNDILSGTKLALTP